MVRYDSLTGLPNRTYFADIVPLFSEFSETISCHLKAKTKGIGERKFNFHFLCLVRNKI